MNQDFKCFFGLHKYEIVQQSEVKNPYGIVVGTSIVSRCTCCGKIKEDFIYTDTNHKRM